MTDLKLQKRLAADILKVGKSKVWISPNKEDQKEVESAITRADVKMLINNGKIKAKPEKIKKPKKKKRRRGPGSRKGKKYARLSRKDRWIKTVRPLRRLLKKMKSEDKINNATYRKVYSLIKGGQFRSRSHMKIYMTQHDMIKEEE